MVSIYCIQDCDGKKYVGSTVKSLSERLNKHKNNKNANDGCSSEKLNLDKCEIYLLETCNESNRHERERYWINEFDTVNEHKLNFDQKEYHKEWRDNNKEKLKEYKKEYNKENGIFRRKRVTNACYEFIKMLEDY
jgi:hypothetical protein